MKKILVTGSNGQVGNELKNLSANYNYSFWFADKKELDISDSSAQQKIQHFQPDLIINCAAYTNVDLAEINKHQAELINTYALKQLANSAKSCMAVLLHISSDYVYDINKKGPLIESDLCSPKSVYAKTKYEGEKLALNCWEKTCIIRTSWVYSTTGVNFVKSMLSLSKSRTKLKIVNDQIGSPTYAGDLAFAIMQVSEKLIAHFENNKYFGTFNFSNEGVISWFDFAKEIFRYKGIPMELETQTSGEYGAPAPRPLWSVMSKSKIKKTFDLTTPNWLDGLHKCLDELEI